ncbi:MAG: glycerophosphodiester phosphodiesterase [Bacteroidales bacterium]|nr:glycerophosphodiester phosphodiesterase [Bacteroidales bacterium]
MKKIFILFAMTLLLNKGYGQVEIIAHRGASYLAPENTVASSRLAFELGADAVEVDIYLSADNKIVCIHDANTKRTTGANHIVKDTGSEVLRSLDAGSWKSADYKGEKIPFLEEVILSVPLGKKLVVELKCGSEVLPLLKKTVEKYLKSREFSFIAFDFQTITDTKKTFSDNPCHWLCSNKILLEKNLPLVQGAGLDGVSLSYGLIDEQVAGKVKDLNLELYTWTVDDPAEALRLIPLGVMGITTNRPGWLREQVF